MEVTDLLSLLGGLALFLYGMQMMSNGLELAAGNRLKQILEKLTSNRIKGVLVGAVVTAVIQSSSATTVMVVGFVNSGLMTLNQAVWIIMGANIGTTITGQLIALDIGAIAPLIAFAGVACIMFMKSEQAKHISSIFAGLGILFIGMDMMGTAMSPLQNSEAFMNFMTTFSNPLYGILFGAGFTALIQSSSASVGILQALASTGMIPLSSAVYILFGQNIGTCITAVLASIGTRTNAKRTTVIHLTFNIFGSVMFTIICMVTPFVGFMESLTADPVAQIANVHTTFNIVTTLILLPFGNYLAKLAVKILPDNDKEEETIQKLEYIRPFESSYGVGQASVAISQIEREVGRMLDKVKKNVAASYDAVVNGGTEALEEINEREDYIDYLNAEISRYIVGLMSYEMPEKDSHSINGYYMILSNLERIGDHAINVAEYTKFMKKWDVKLSDDAKDEVQKMKEINLQIMDHISFAEGTDAEAVLAAVEKDEDQIDDMQKKYLKRQIKRAKKGESKAETGIMFSELLTDFERIGDYALNVAQLYREMVVPSQGKRLNIEKE